MPIRKLNSRQRARFRHLIAAGDNQSPIAPGVVRIACVVEPEFGHLATYHFVITGVGVRALRRLVPNLSTEG